MAVRKQTAKEKAEAAAAALPGEEAEETSKTSATSEFTSIGGRIVRRSPIGVGEGYRAPYRNQRLSQANQTSAAVEGNSFEQGIAPQYFEDDLTRFATLDGEAMTNVQYALQSSGLLKKFRKGVWTEAEENAMASVLAYANRRGLLWEDALDEFATEGVSVGGEGEGRQFTARLSNPDDLKKAFTQSLYDAQGGRFMDDTQMQQMIDAYQQIEYGAQRAAFDNAGTVEEPPSATTFAEHRAKEIDAAGVEAAKFADYGQIFEELINQ